MRTRTPTIRSSFIILVSSIISVLVVGAFSVVWLQQEINQTARNSLLLDNELGDTIDKIRYLDEKISKFHQPIVLQAKVARSLRPSKGNQVVWISERSSLRGHICAHATPYRKKDIQFFKLNIILNRSIQ